MGRSTSWGRPGGPFSHVLEPVGSLVRLLRLSQMVVQEAINLPASLSQGLLKLRSLHIFLEQDQRHFEEQSGGEMGAAIWLAQGLALQLCTDCQLSELFHHKEFMLATLLDPRFKGQIEAILPVGLTLTTGSKFSCTR